MARSRQQQSANARFVMMMGFLLMVAAGGLFLGTGGTATVAATISSSAEGESDPKFAWVNDLLSSSDKSTPAFTIVNGVPNDQIKPDTPIMNRLPPKPEGFGAKLYRTAMNPPQHDTFPKINGWTPVTDVDVRAVTPLQVVYHDMEQGTFGEDLAKTGAQMLFLMEYAKDNTNKVNAYLGSNSIAYFAPSGGMIVADVREHAALATPEGQPAETVEERFARLVEAGYDLRAEMDEVAGRSIARLPYAKTIMTQMPGLTDDSRKRGEQVMATMGYEPVRVMTMIDKTRTIRLMGWATADELEGFIAQLPRV